MNQLSHLSLTIKINKPVETVWKSLVNWHEQSNWMLQTKVWSEVDQDRTVKNGKGVLIFAFTGLFPSLYPKLRLGVLESSWRKYFLLARGFNCTSLCFDYFKTALVTRCLALIAPICTATIRIGSKVLTLPSNLYSWHLKAAARLLLS